jgi:hypothetical protein
MTRIIGARNSRSRHVDYADARDRIRLDALGVQQLSGGGS